MTIENEKEFGYQISIDLQPFGKVNHQSVFAGIEYASIEPVAGIDLVVLYWKIHWKSGMPSPLKISNPEG
jgi:hypothetical protein